MSQLYPREEPEQIIENWLKTNPDKAVKLARSVLTAYFVDHDETGNPVQLNPERNLDLQDLDEQIFDSVTASGFFEHAWPGEPCGGHRWS